jgi:hypothetical protein
MEWETSRCLEWIGWCESSYHAASGTCQLAIKLTSNKVNARMELQLRTETNIFSEVNRLTLQLSHDSSSISKILKVLVGCQTGVYSNTPSQPIASFCYLPTLLDSCRNNLQNFSLQTVQNCSVHCPVTQQVLDYQARLALGTDAS